MNKINSIVFGLILSFFSSNSFAKTFLYTCVSDKQFMMLYKIDTSKKTVFHISSMTTDGQQKFQVNKYEKVLRWVNNEISLYNTYTSNLSYRTIFLDKDIILSTAHYTDGNVFQQKFKCNRDRQ